MSKEILEVRWHGRGGQGAKTASLLFADAAMSTGKFIQGFPEYGPERMGAPVASFNRISDKPITLHCGITNPDIVVVLDPTLMGTVNVVEGLGPNGILLVNTTKSVPEVCKEAGLCSGKAYVVDASGIAKAAIGREIPNTPMLGALIKVTGMLDLEATIKDLEKKLSKKFAHKPEVIAGNLEAVKRAYQEVKE
ncbi:2-oxoacid:acceptor oxidoreductase family protein [Patescibacteria group bacterium]|nr:2-oxoacid:acceptor oxidoreductase family protein [Patescibacteria group bacterium]